MPKNVWKDDKHSSTILRDFHLFKNGVEVQSGVMEPFSSTGNTVYVYLNRYAQPFLKSVFPGIDNGVIPDPDASGLFEMTYTNTGSVATSEVYVNGYAGEFKEDMWEPIDGKADPRQKLYATQYSDSAKTRSVYTSCEGYCYGCCGKYIKLDPSKLVQGKDNEYIFSYYANQSGNCYFDVYDTNIPIVRGEKTPIICWTGDPDYPDGYPGWDMFNYTIPVWGGDAEDMLVKFSAPWSPDGSYQFGDYSRSVLGRNNGAYGARLKNNTTGEDRWCYFDIYRETECLVPDYNCHYARVWIYQYGEDA